MQNVQPSAQKPVLLLNCILVQIVQAVLIALKQFIGLLLDSVFSCGLTALLLQLPLMKAVGPGS